jgi:hypothetical protein
MMPKPLIKTIAELRKAFAFTPQFTHVIDPKYWIVSVDAGGCSLKYIGTNPEGLEPEKPVDLDLPTGSGLIAELFHEAGIPAERA